MIFGRKVFLFNFKFNLSVIFVDFGLLILSSLILLSQGKVLFQFLIGVIYSLSDSWTTSLLLLAELDTRERGLSVWVLAISTCSDV